jgi:predicted nucleic acid-binding protein
VRFWDSSAIVGLLVEEAHSPALFAAYEHDPEVLVWWATEVECTSALARLERGGILSGVGLGEALDRLAALARSWREIQPISQVRETAIRLLRVHPLRAADALQLAAAIAAAEGRPASLGFVTLDDRLGLAADREGFVVDAPGRVARLE